MSDEIAQGREPSRPPSYDRYRRSLLLGGAAVALLVVIAVVGLVRGRSDPTPTPSVSATTSTPTGPPLTLTNLRCAFVYDGTLIASFGVVNSGADDLTITQVIPSFPIGGLTPATTVATDRPQLCPSSPFPATLAPGDDAALTLLLVPEKPTCVAPLVVDVDVEYRVPGSSSGMFADLRPFPDLGGFELPSDC